jgi:DNA-binding NarL/FixJ family response regulator
MAPEAANNAPIAPTTVARRKQEVVDLVARGLTNRQIVSKLHLSDRTIEKHVSKILRKLALASRAEIAAWQHDKGSSPPSPSSSPIAVCIVIEPPWLSEA